MKRFFLFSFALVLLSRAGLVAGQEAAKLQGLTADNIIEKSQLAFYAHGDDSRSSFVGSDFTYEDISGRDVTSHPQTSRRRGAWRADELPGREHTVFQG